MEYVVLKDETRLIIEADSPEHAIRISDNLSDEADLKFASSVVLGQYLESDV